MRKLNTNQRLAIHALKLAVHGSRNFDYMRPHVFANFNVIQGYMSWLLSEHVHGTSTEYWQEYITNIRKRLEWSRIDRRMLRKLP